MVLGRLKGTASAHEGPPPRPTVAPEFAAGASFAQYASRPRPHPPAAAVLYMRTCRRRRLPLTRAPETRNKPLHGPPVAPPACPWRGLSRVSRARVPLYRRRRELRRLACPKNVTKTQKRISFQSKGSAERASGRERHRPACGCVCVLRSVLVLARPHVCRSQIDELSVF